MTRYKGKELDRQFGLVMDAMRKVPTGMCQLCRKAAAVRDFDAMFADLQTHREEGGELHVQGQCKLHLCQSCFDAARNHPLTQRSGDA